MPVSYVNGGSAKALFDAHAGRNDRDCNIFMKVFGSYGIDAGSVSRFIFFVNMVRVFGYNFGRVVKFFFLRRGFFNFFFQRRGIAIFGRYLNGDYKRHRVVVTSREFTLELGRVSGGTESEGGVGYYFGFGLEYGHPGLERRLALQPRGAYQ